MPRLKSTLTIEEKKLAKRLYDQQYYKDKKEGKKRNNKVYKPKKEKIPRIKMTEEQRREKRNAYSREYAKNNKEKINAYYRLYFKKNRDKHRESSDKWIEKNRERVRETKRKYDYNKAIAAGKIPKCDIPPLTEEQKREKYLKTLEYNRAYRKAKYYDPINGAEWRAKQVAYCRQWRAKKRAEREFQKSILEKLEKEALNKSFEKVTSELLSKERKMSKPFHMNPKEERDQIKEMCRLYALHKSLRKKAERQLKISEGRE